MGKKDNCGCDNDYFNLINSSPILSGSQENAFDPEHLNSLNSLNNNFNLDINESPILFDKKNSQIPDINLEVIPQKKINDNNINMNMNNMNNMNNMAPSFSNNSQNNSIQVQPTQQVNNNNVLQQQLTNNALQQQLTNNALQQLNNTNQQNNSNGNGVNANGNAGNTGNDGTDGNAVNANGMNGNNKEIFSKYNYILLIIVALAWNDIIKYYINRAIKFNGGTHHYYLYYGISVTVLIFITSKILQKI